MLTVSLPPELEQLVNESVASGRYQSPADVVQQALLLLKQRDAEYQRRLEELRREIDIGIDQIERGEFTEYDDTTLPKLVDEIKEAGRRRSAELGRVIKP